MTEQIEASPTEAAQSAISMGLSALNGVFALAAAMAGRGLLSKADVKYLHENMLQPLNNEGGSAEIMALQTKRLDELCATLVRAIEKLDSGEPL